MKQTAFKYQELLPNAQEVAEVNLFEEEYRDKADEIVCAMVEMYMFQLYDAKIEDVHIRYTGSEIDQVQMLVAGSSEFISKLHVDYIASHIYQATYMKCLADIQTLDQYYTEDGQKI